MYAFEFVEEPEQPAITAGCAFCDNPPAGCALACVTRSDDDADRFVMCCNCKACGPIFPRGDGPFLAVDAWNKRSVQGAKMAARQDASAAICGND